MKLPLLLARSKAHEDDPSGSGRILPCSGGGGSSSFPPCLGLHRIEVTLVGDQGYSQETEGAQGGAEGTSKRKASAATDPPLSSKPLLPPPDSTVPSGLLGFVARISGSFFADADAASTVAAELTKRAGEDEGGRWRRNAVSHIPPCPSTARSLLQPASSRPASWCDAASSSSRGGEAEHGGVLLSAAASVGVELGRGAGEAPGSFLPALELRYSLSEGHSAADLVKDVLALVNMQRMLAELESLVPRAGSLATQPSRLSVVSHGLRAPTAAAAPPSAKKPRIASPRSTRKSGPGAVPVAAAAAAAAPAPVLSWLWPGSGALSLMRYGYSAAVLRCQGAIRADGEADEGGNPAPCSTYVDLHMQWGSQRAATAPTRDDDVDDENDDGSRVPDCCRVSCRVLARAGARDVDQGPKSTCPPRDGPMPASLPSEVASSYGASVDSCLGGSMGLLLDTLAITAPPMICLLYTSDAADE